MAFAKETSIYYTCYRESTNQVHLMECHGLLSYLVLFVSSKHTRALPWTTLNVQILSTWLSILQARCHNHHKPIDIQMKPESNILMMRPQSSYLNNRTRIHKFNHLQKYCKLCLRKLLDKLQTVLRKATGRNQVLTDKFLNCIMHQLLLQVYENRFMLLIISSHKGAYC